MAQVPYKLGAPTVAEKTSTTITLTWPRYYGSNFSESIGHDYELQVCESYKKNPATGVYEAQSCEDDSSDWELEAYVPSSTLSYTDTGLIAKKPDGPDAGKQLLYKYRVRATCVCEEAEFSEELCVELSEVPATPSPSCPNYISTCRNFEFKWTRDDDASISMYEV